MAKFSALRKQVEEFAGGEWREMFEAFKNGETDFEVNGYRFIYEDNIDEIMGDELSSDPYILGCFNASFIAAVTGLPEAIIKAAQDGEEHEAIGQWLIDEGHVYDSSGPAHYGGIVANYVQSDGYGHHFATYDGEEHFIKGYGNCASNCLTDYNARYYVFRVN